MGDWQAEGTLRLSKHGILSANDALGFNPRIQAVLQEVEDNGWKYLFIETFGTALYELKLVEAPCEIGTYGSGMDPEEKTTTHVQLEMSPEALRLVDVPELDTFVVNISTKHFPRAITVELSKLAVTYIHEALWSLQENESDEKKLREAKEVHEVFRWAIQEKKMQLGEGLDPIRIAKLMEYPFP